MKFVFGLLLIGVVAVVLTYNFGGIASFDPDETGKQVKEQLKPGQDWTHVATNIKAPKKWQAMVEMEGAIVPSMERKFNEQTFKKSLNNGDLPHGFVFTYRFSEKTAFQAFFGPGGKLESVEDMRTMSSLLNAD